MLSKDPISGVFVTHNLNLKIYYLLWQSTHFKSFLSLISMLQLLSLQHLTFGWIKVCLILLLLLSISWLWIRNQNIWQLVYSRHKALIELLLFINCNLSKEYKPANKIIVTWNMKKQICRKHCVELGFGCIKFCVQSTLHLLVVYDVLANVIYFCIKLN